MDEDGIFTSYSDVVMTSTCLQDSVFGNATNHLPPALPENFIAYVA